MKSSCANKSSRDLSVYASNVLEQHTICELADVGLVSAILDISPSSDREAFRQKLLNVMQSEHEYWIRSLRHSCLPHTSNARDLTCDLFSSRWLKQNSDGSTIQINVPVRNITYTRRWSGAKDDRGLDEADVVEITTVRRWPSNTLSRPGEDTPVT